MGASPTRVKAGEPGSRPRSVAERRRAERGVKSLFGGSKCAGRSAIRRESCSLVTVTTEEPSRSRHGEGSIRPLAFRTCAGRVLPGYGERHVHMAWFGTGEIRLPSLVSKDRSYKPVVKSSGGKRKSGGVVVLLIVGSNPRGGKGPDFGHAGDRARCEDMAGTARSNSPSGPMPVVSARGLCQRLWARAKESSRPRCAGLDPRCADLAPGASVTDVGEAA